MKIIFLSTVLLVLLQFIGAQPVYESVLAEIESNSLTLSALRERLEAEELGIKTGIFPDNPEVELGYLWGDPSAIGMRYDYSVTQSIDFPTVYAHKRRLAGQEIDNAEIEYRLNRAEILLEARMVLVELLYRNTMMEELLKRVEDAGKIAFSVRSQMERGESGVIEYNKAMMNLASVKKESEINDLERRELLSVLKSMNGGVEITNENEVLIRSFLPEDFDEWYAGMEENNPRLLSAMGVTWVAESTIKLSKANSLPKFSAGFMSENIVGERYQGLVLGVSVPLWENRNEIGRARADARASRLEEDDIRIQVYYTLKNIYERAKGLRNLADGFMSSLEENDNTELLLKGFEIGEISLIDYLQELGFYYDAVDNLLETEKDGELAAAQLWAAGL